MIPPIPRDHALVPYVHVPEVAPRRFRAVEIIAETVKAAREFDVILDKAFAEGCDEASPVDDEVFDEPLVFPPSVLLDVPLFRAPNEGDLTIGGHPVRARNVTFIPGPPSPKDMEYMELRKWALEQIARDFSMPKLYPVRK